MRNLRYRMLCFVATQIFDFCNCFHFPSYISHATSPKHIRSNFILSGEAVTAEKAFDPLVGPISILKDKVQSNADVSSPQQGIPNIDLFDRTWKSLDFGVILENLSNQCTTAMGQRLALRADFKSDVQTIHDAYSCVDEVYSLPESIPLANGMDIEPLIELAAKGVTLEPLELREVSDCLTSLSSLIAFFDEEMNAMYPILGLKRLIQPIFLDPELIDLLLDAFDSSGELCRKKFPEIGRLRKQIDKLHDSIRSSVQKLLSSGVYSEMLANEGGGAYISEINGRFVLPVKPTYKKNVGIVHDVSRTGKTLFIEPASVVEPTNELVELKVALKAEESRILLRMTMKIGQNKDHLLASLAAAAEVDLACARAKLGTLLGGTIPEVGQEGTIRLRSARHPVLALRNKNPVPNDLELSKDSQALVLTGPNAGGKTVILKTLGLVALMVRSGIPIPASNGARVDLFEPVLADIGDLQSVTGDISTFSGHLMVCKAVLQNARPGSLVLMDEMGSGTDPAQGVALAQALLEALLDSGARVALTTHYLQLKELAVGDDRFRVAAMQFVDGRPTYRLIPGTIGESFALAVAESLELPTLVIERAKSLLDEGTRQVSDLIRELEQERDNLRLQVLEIEEMKGNLKKKESEFDEIKRQVEKSKEDVKRQAAKEYAEDLKEREAKLKDIFEKIKKDPSLSVIGAAIGTLQTIKYQTENESREEVDDLGLSPLDLGHELNPGDNVVVCKPGIMYGRPGTVIRGAKNGTVEINIGGLATITYQLKDLSLPPKGRSVNKTQSRLASRARLNEMPGKKKGRGGYQGKNVQSSASDTGSTASRVFVRVPGNTLDLRGKNLEESKDLCEEFFNRCIMNGNRVGYVLHGHGTGVLKQGLRSWFPKSSMVKKFRPADQSDGGDAYTLVEL